MAKTKSVPPAVAGGSTAPATSRTTGSTGNGEAPTKEKGKFGFEKWASVPSLTLAIKSQPAQFDFPASSRPKERATFTDGTLQFSMRNEMARGWFGAQTSFDFAGST